MNISKKFRDVHLNYAISFMEILKRKSYINSPYTLFSAMENSKMNKFSIFDFPFFDSLKWIAGSELRF